tara:strand:- start:903 stop:1415 length:513 start_codon:yes stop_codon:yes gene_type:complete
MSDSNEPSGASFNSTQGADLSNVTISEVYKDLLTINDSSSNNEGLTNALKHLRDGAGFSLPLRVSRTSVAVEGDLFVDDLHIANTINLDSINQFLFNMPSGATGKVFKIKVGDTDVFSVDAQGNITSPSIDNSASSVEQALAFSITTEEDISSPNEGMLRWDGSNLLLYK